MIQVTSREFREKQAHLFDMADRGEQVIIRRRSKTAYMLVPVADEEVTITPELEAKIAKARVELQAGKTVSCKDASEAVKFLESL